MPSNREQLQRKLAETEAACAAMRAELEKMSKDEGVMVAPGTVVKLPNGDNVRVVGDCCGWPVVHIIGIGYRGYQCANLRTLDGRPIKGVLPVEFTREETVSLMRKAWSAGWGHDDPDLTEWIDEVLAEREGGAS